MAWPISQRAKDMEREQEVKDGKTPSQAALTNRQNGRIVRDAQKAAKENK